MLRTRTHVRTHPRRHRGDPPWWVSQNFLTGPGVARHVVRAARLDPSDLVWEVGAGTGVLTRALAASCRRVVAYEVDPALAGTLRERCRGVPGVRCVHGDFLAATPPREDFVVVGNIPYSVTASIVEWCLSAPRLRSATLVTQWEYARKRTGGYGRWSRLTVASWPWFSWELAGRISRHRFRPVPGVDAGILRLERRPTPLVADPAAWRDLVTLGFSGVGGSLYASLRRRHPGRRLRAAFRAAGVDPATPVGHVSPGEWLTIFDAVR